MPNTDDILPRLIEAANRSAPLAEGEAKALLLEAADVIRTLRILVGIREEVEGRTSNRRRFPATGLRRTGPFAASGYLRAPEGSRPRTGNLLQCGSQMRNRTTDQSPS